jgi:hypothetical protein
MTIEIRRAVVVDLHHIEDNINKLRSRIARACERSYRDLAEVKVIAVTKNFSSAVVRDAIQCGLRDFGENRVQEAYAKYKELDDMRPLIRLHFIGHLQTNKVKDALETVDIIHSIDTLRLAQVINERATRKLPVLIQVNITGEETKYGFSVNEIDTAVKQISGMPNIEIWGLMTVAPLVADPQEVRPVFIRLKKLNTSYGFKELSMGMTDDFEVAIEEGATMVRIGRAIFGERS